MAFDLNFLRRQNIFDQFGQPDDSMNYGGDDMSSLNPNLSSDPTTSDVGSLPSGQEPQNPFAAQLFRQSLQPGNGSEPKTDWIAKYRELYQPQTSAQDRLNNLLSNFPKDETPSLGRRLVAMGAGLGKGGIEESRKILDEPNADALARWKMQAEPFLQAASNERQGNVNERTLAQQSIAAAQRQEQLDEASRKNQAVEAETHKKNEDTVEIARKKNELALEKMEGASFDFKGASVIVTRPDGTVYDSGVPSTNFDPMERARLASQTKIATTNATNASKEKIAETGAASREIYNIPDPNDPTKTIAVRIDPITNKVKRVTLDDQPVGPAAAPKGGTGAGGPAGQFTTQTRTMMEGAKMILPAIDRVGKQAADLEANNLFGPVMSRVRDLAAKIGTTGNPDEVQRSLQDFALALQDPSFNPGDDYRVGKFLTSLGFLASGAGRVHGGARGGGSIAMVNYMKGLLTSDSTLNMFNSRLGALQDQMKDYAVGPNGETVTGAGSNPALDSALDKILGKAK